MARRDHRERVFFVALGLWGLWIALVNAYFGAFRFGITPPAFLNWIGNIPDSVFLVVDTLGVLTLFGLLIVEHRENREHRRRHGPLQGVLFRRRG